ncbi:glycosyl transferase [Janthinobacterium sp. BJB412]|nr:glycosyl transferase [Janthinobacterium sp. BJB412]
MSGARLMGRQAAGNAFLRAAVAGRGGAMLHAYTPHRSSAEAFAGIVRTLDPTAEGSGWVPADRLDLLAGIGTLYLPGPGLDQAARLRLRAGPDAYSLVGVTHTTASHGAMDSIVGLLAAPVMPWDALICTSRAVLSTVQTLLQAEQEHLRWRFGRDLKLTLPQFPVIPLGVHCADYALGANERDSARAALGIGADEVVVLYVGRLSFHAKAHPHAMYAGLQGAAERSGKKIVLLQCGWFSNDAVEQSYRDGASQFCPALRALFADGRDADLRRQCWAAGDLFVSLSDNIQETFGLTPIEAMAAGMPVVVSDWDGYKDTVRDGVDGFRIPTSMPPPTLGEGFARAHEAGMENYDFYCGLTCQTIALDMQVLAERLADLVADAALRRRMGEAGQERARQQYDWAVVYRQYQALWQGLGTLRRQARHDPAQQALLEAAPRQAPGRLDPYLSFGHYPTALVQPRSVVRTLPGASLAAYQRLASHGLFNYAAAVLPAAPQVEAVLAALAGGALPLEECARRAGLALGPAVLALSVLAKMGLLRLQPAEPQPV